MEAVVGETVFELTQLDVIAGPETAARLAVPVGTVIRTVRFDEDGGLVDVVNLDQESTP